MKHRFKHTLLVFSFAATTQTIAILGSSINHCISSTCDIEEYLEHAENILTREQIHKKPFYDNFLAHFNGNYASTKNNQERAVQARILDKIVICQKVASGVIGESRRKVGGWLKRDIESQCVESTCDFNEYVEVMENDFGEAITHDWDLKSTFESDYVEKVKREEAKLGEDLNKKAVRQQGIDRVQQYLMVWGNF